MSFQEVARDHEGTEKIRIREERHQRSELRKIREQQKEEEEQQQRDSAEKVEKEVTVDQTISEVAAAAAAVEEKPGTPEPVGRMVILKEKKTDFLPKINHFAIYHFFQNIDFSKKKFFLKKIYFSKKIR